MGHRGVPVELPKLKPQRFVSHQNQLIYAAIVSQKRKQQPYDLISVKHFLEREGLLTQAGGAAYLASLLDAPATPSSLEWYTELITEAAARRLCASLGNDLQGLALEPTGNRSAAALMARIATIKHRMETAVHFNPTIGGLNSLHIGDVYRRSSDGPPWLMAPWIAEGDLVICLGEQGLGKSFVAFQLAMALSLGGAMLDRVHRKSKRVLYVDAENNPFLITYRARRLVDGLGLGLKDVDRMPLYYVDVSREGLALDTDEGMAMLTEECRRRQPEVVILDSLMDFQDLDENSNSEMKRWMNRQLRPFMAKHNITLIALHHMRKPATHEAGPSMHRGRGASAITGVADQVWALEKTPQGQMVLKHEKCRWGQAATPLDLTLEDVNHGNGVLVTTMEHQNDAYDVICEVLSRRDGEKLSKRQLKDIVRSRTGECLDSGLYHLLNRLQRERKIRRFMRGKEAIYEWVWAKEMGDGPKQWPAVSEDGDAAGEGDADESLAVEGSANGGPDDAVEESPLTKHDRLPYADL